MPTFQFLPSIRDSETTICRHCNTFQYANATCIRCRRPLGVEYVYFGTYISQDPCSEDHSKQLVHSIGNLLRVLRSRRGICQSQLAAKGSGIDRSYLSKAEHGLANLSLSKLLALLQSLGLTAVILRFEASPPRKAFKSG
jgi:ribosome-binding protein aMBF1 (putative translation factor)